MWTFRECIKPRDSHADSEGMIISDEQARLAAQYLRTGRSNRCGSIDCHVDGDVVARAVAAATSAPDSRIERVEEARHRLDLGTVDSREVAAKMISRIVSDSIR